MKILITADPELPVPPKLYGGIERIVDILVHNFVAEGHEVTLMAHPESSVPCRLIPWQAHKSNGLANTALNMALLSVQIFRGRYDIVHSFSRLAYLMPALPLNVPKIMSYQREPTIQQIRRANKLAKKQSLHFTGCSDYITRKISPFAAASTIYNCVPMERYVATETVPPDAPLAFLGRIEPVKGTHLAVEVAKRTGRRLLIAGNIPGEAQSYFEKEVKPFLDDRIQYIGPVDDRQKNDMLRECSCLLMPIQWNEPFGIVMPEAMACGTPVLGFRRGSVPEVVEDGVTGFVCDDLERMVERVRDVTQLNRLLVRQQAERRFSGQTISEAYLQLYRQHSQRAT